MPDFGFIGDAYAAPSIYQDAQELINWYGEHDPRKKEGERGVVALYPTPGFGSPLLTFGAGGQVRGLKVLRGGQTMLAVCGSVAYSVNSSMVATQIGTLASTTGRVVIEDNGIAAYFVDGANRYGYNYASGGAFANVGAGDGAFSGADIVVEADNYFFYNEPGGQQFAATNPVGNPTAASTTATPALSFASKFGAGDNLVSMIAVSRELALIGEYSSEWWADVGDFPFPYAIIPGTSGQCGCAAKHSVSRLGDTFAFVSQDLRGQGMVMMAVGYTFKRISTHSVEQTLVGQTISDAISWTYQIEGHEFYVVTFPTIDITWVFDLSTQMWNKWLSVDSDNRFHRHRGNCAAVFQGMNLIGDYANGNLYQLSNSVFTENGNTIRRVRRAPHIVADFNRVFHHSLQLQFQPGVGLATGQGQNPKAMLRWSDDGGSTWSNEHWKSMGTTGYYKDRVIWRRLGYARDRVYEVAVTDPVYCPIISAELVAKGAES